MFAFEIYPRAKEITGLSSQRVILERLSETVTLLANAGDWSPVIGWCDIRGFETDCRTFCLPYDVETPMAVNLNGRPTYMRNQWQEYHLNGLGSNHETPWTWDDQGPSPTLQDIIRPASLIALTDLKNDLFTKIQVFGYDIQGRRMRSQNADGTWNDGFFVTPNLITDFPSAVVQENTNRFFWRNFSAIPVTTLVSSTPMYFETGVSVLLSLVAGTLPIPLVNEGTYFLGVKDDYAVQLYSLLSDATAGTNVIEMLNVSPSTILNLQDKRQIQVQTKFTSSSNLNFLEASAVTFTATTLPEPITGNETFYINLIDDQNFTIHATAQDALNGINPLFVTTPGSMDLVANAQQPVTPYTKLVFSVPHRFIQNDIVTASNASGDLPTPLLPATNYYVRVLSATEITLHTSLSDAASGNNPIVLTDNGTGTSSIVKLIPATANVGSVNNISAPNSNLVPGDYVQFASTGALPTPILGGQIYVVTSPAGAGSFTIATPPAIPVATTGRLRSNNTSVLTTNGPHGLVTGNFVNISGVGGSDYNVSQVAVTYLAANAFSYPNTGADENNVATVSRSRSNEIAVIETALAHGFSTGDFVNIQNLGGSSYNLPWVQVTVIDATKFQYNNIGINDIGFATTARLRSANVARITTIAPHGLSPGQYVNVQGMTDPTFNNSNALIIVTATATTFTYANTGPNLGNTADTRGFVAIPQADVNGLVGTVLADTGGLVSGNLVNLTDVGTGVLNAVISRAFTIGFYDNWFLDASKLTTGASFKIDTSGALPLTSPVLSPTTTYYVRVLDDFTAQFFVSMAKALDTTVRLTATEERTSNVSTLTTQSAHGFVTGDVVEIGFMSDASFNTPEGQGVTITVIDPVTFTYANNGIDVAATPDITGQVIYSPINILALGSGETDMILSRPVTVGVLSSLLEVTNAAYILPNTPYQFQTDGTLPSPIVTGTNYLINVINGKLAVSDTSGNPITLTDIGSGSHYISRDFNVAIGIPSGVQVLANEYNDGDAAIINQPGSVTPGTPPAPLTAGQRVYIRRIDDETVELYNSQAAAMNYGSTSGLIIVTNKGSGINTLFQILPAYQISRIERVLLIDGQSPEQAALPNTTPLGQQPPPQRNGFIDLYAWDYGRKDNLTLLGHYCPQEIEPSYRRIKVAQCTNWIRMKYRRKTYKITSLQDYIPLTSEMAVLYMLRAQELYRTNFFDEGQKYEALAVNYLVQENDARNGPESIGIQINDDVYTNSGAAWME